MREATELQVRGQCEASLSRSLHIERTDLTLVQSVTPERHKRGLSAQSEAAAEKNYGDRVSKHETIVAQFYSQRPK